MKSAIINKIENKEEYYCVKRVSDLLSENRLKEAFELLEEYIERANLIDYLSDLTTIKSKFHRSKKAIDFSLISWDQYQVDNSRVINCAMVFSKELCEYLSNHHGNTESAFKTPSTKETQGRLIAANQVRSQKFSPFINTIFLYFVFCGGVAFAFTLPLEKIYRKVMAEPHSAEYLAGATVVLLIFALTYLLHRFLPPNMYGIMRRTRTKSHESLTESFKALIEEINALEPKEPEND